MTMITKDQLKPGDVLLYKSDGSLIDRLICLFDGSDYSHSSICYDPTAPGKIAEAVDIGVVSHSFAQSIDPERSVDVYRFRSDSEAKLGDPGYPSDPVTQRAIYYVSQGERYAYEQLLMLALLATTRRLPFNWAPGIGIFLREILDNATEVLNKIIAAGKQPMICSELVYRCYAEAGDKYILKIVGTEALMKYSIHSAHVANMVPLASPENGDRELQALSAASEAFLQKYATVKGKQTMLSAPVLPVVADFVTPHDLSQSPNLYLMGQLVTS